MWLIFLNRANFFNMRRLKFFIILAFLVNVGESQTILDYLRFKDLQSLKEDYEFEEERIIDSLLQFSMSVEDTTTSMLMWYNHLSVIQNPFEEQDSTKYCSLKFKAYAWIKLILCEHEEERAAIQNELFVITNEKGEKLYDYRISKNENLTLFIKDHSNPFIETLDEKMEEWQKALRDKGIDYKKSKKPLPFKGYFMRNWLK